MPSKGTWLTRLILRNKRIKAISLILAAITWYSIRDAISFEIIVPDVRLDVLVKDGMAILNQSVTTADVTFRGSQEDIRLLDPKQIKVAVDLREEGAGYEEIAISPEHVMGARGVRAVQVKPAKLKVTLDRENEKTVPVRGMYNGKPLLGQVESVVCDPASVEIRGPARKLEATEFVYTEPVDVDGRIQSFAKRCRILPPSDTWVARLNPPEAQVRVNIVERSAKRTWKDIPVQPVVNQGSSTRVEIRPPKVNVVISGHSEVLDKIEETDLRVLVDCTALQAPGEHDVPVYVHLNNSMDVTATAEPEVVHIALKP